MTTTNSTAPAHPAFASWLRPPQSAETLTDEMIHALRREAAEAGDDATVHYCWVAIGDREPGAGGMQAPESVDDARERIAEIISDARCAAADDGRDPWTGVVA